MLPHTSGGTLTEEQLRQFHQDGYLIVKGLFAREAEELKELFMAMHAGGPIPGCFNPVPESEAGGDVLKLYPRMMHPHRVNETAKENMIHPKLMDRLADLFGEEALAAQSMFYFKPPGAKGQALHQDNFYLKVDPGNCIAAWVAVDSADEENGGMYVVPGSHRTDLQCPHRADPAVSFTREEVDVPAGLEPIPARLEAGDVLFFNGNMIHGSYPNSSRDRFRRAFICHYTGMSTTQIGRHYTPLFTRDGAAVGMEGNTRSGPCGNEFAQAAAPH